MPQDIYKSYIEKLLTRYQHPELAKKDILSAIKNYRSLSPKLEAFVFNNGYKKDLLCLEGTIPVSYKGSTYNIPVCIWLQESHPYNSPICYVKPTPQMEIKTSVNVDSSGRIFLPYLHDWHHKRSDLLGLIQVMIIVFGDAPPVYTRRKPPQTNSVVNAAPYPPSATVPAPYPTPYVPPPTVTGAMPPYPPSSNAGFPTPYPQPGFPAPMPMPPYPPTSTTTPVAYPPSTTSQQQSTGTISEEHIHASLLSAVEDKMKKRLREVLSQAQAEMEVLKKTHDDLNTGKNKLDSILVSLQGEQTAMEKNLAIMKEKNQEMKDLISKLEGEEAMDLDEAVVTTAPLYKQLLNAHAQENATEDAIYYLGEALRKEVIDLDIFLKHVRELSRSQFMLKALMQKTRQKAGLPY